MYKRILQYINKYSTSVKAISDEQMPLLADELHTTTNELEMVIKSLSEAGFVSKSSYWNRSMPPGTWKSDYRLTDDGRRTLGSDIHPGNGIILDEPYTSALLRLGLKENLIKTHLKFPYRAMPRELAKGLSPIIQEDALTSLVLFENVVIPSDKALVEYFDWSPMEEALGIRIVGGIGIKEKIREESFRRWPDDIKPLSQNDLSGWDTIVRSYLNKRGYPIDKDFIKKHLVEMDHRDLWPILERGTQEEKGLFFPEMITHKLKLHLKDEFGFDKPRTDIERNIYADYEKLFWLFETFFHLRFLKKLANNSFMPSAVHTSIGHVGATRSIPLDKNAEYVYSIFLDEVRTLPRPRSLQEVIELRKEPALQDFQQYFHTWHETISAGDMAGEQKLRVALRKTVSSFANLKYWKTISGWSTYIGLPAGILAAIVTHPVMAIGGLVLSVVGGVSQAWIDISERKKRWLLLGTEHKVA